MWSQGRCPQRESTGGEVGASSTSQSKPSALLQPFHNTVHALNSIDRLPSYQKIVTLLENSKKMTLLPVFSISKKEISNFSFYLMGGKNALKVLFPGHRA